MEGTATAEPQMSADRPQAPGPLLQVLLANLHGYYSDRARLNPAARILEEEGLLLIDSGTSLRESNIAFVIGSVPDPAAALDRAAGILGQRTGWRFEAPIESGTRFDSAASGAGLSERLVRPAFTLTPDQGHFAGLPAGFEAIEVVSPGDHRRFIETLVWGFSGRPLPRSTDIGGTRFDRVTSFLGLCQGDPVATAQLYVKEGIAGIYGVSTIPSARRKGLGRAISQAAVQHAFREGCSLAFLQSSAVAIHVYESMGFRPAFDHVTWLTPREASSVNAPSTSGRA